MLSGFSRVWLFAVPWTVDFQAPPSMGFSQWEYWSGFPFPPPGDPPDPGIELVSLLSPELQADSLPPEPQGKSLKLCITIYPCRNYSQLWEEGCIGQLGWDKTPAGWSLVNSFSWGETLLRRTKCSGVFQNGGPSLPLAVAAGDFPPISFVRTWCKSRR